MNLLFAQAWGAGMAQNLKYNWKKIIIVNDLH